MKKISMLLVLTAVLLAPAVFAEDMAKSMPMQDSQMMKVHQCSMDGYTAEKAGECPLCGMKLEEKELPADEAKAALEKSKEAKE